MQSLLTHDENFIYTFEVDKGKPLRQLKLRKLNISGYLVDRQVLYNPSLSHVGIILGIEESGRFPDDLIVIAFDTEGLEVGALTKFSAGLPVQFTRPYPFNLNSFLDRAQTIQLDRLPSYSIMQYNCQTFVGDLMYGCTNRTPSPCALITLAISAAFIGLLAFSPSSKNLVSK